MKILDFKHNKDGPEDRFDLTVELEDGTCRTYIGCRLRKIEENADRRGGRYGSLFIETVTLELSPEMFEDR